jgi:hypothetical protein
VLGNHPIGLGSGPFQNPISLPATVLHHSFTISEQFISSHHGLGQQLADFFDEVKDLSTVKNA